MKEQFKHKRFHETTLEIINQANRIITEMESQGFILTVRQLYYQFVARDLIPNSQKSYDKILITINDARLAGLIDWCMIEDRTRNLQKNQHWNEPSEIIDACISQYAVDKWASQDYRPEVWIEKEALAGVISSICDDLDVSWFCCRGYPSQSEMYNSGKRLKRCIENQNQTPIILHFGDHDPSGIDMTRDIEARLNLFSGYEIPVIRIALNIDQVRTYNLPANPAKITDTRCNAYLETYGNESWELDALEPRVIKDLIQASVLQYRDDTAWSEALRKEKRGRDDLSKFQAMITADDTDAE